MRDIFLCLALMFAAGLTGYAQVSARQIDAILRPFTSNHGPGMAVGVIHHGRLVFARGYGLANVEEQIAITPHTDFRLASVTKQFTAMAIMRLVHEGKLRYDDPLTKIIPEFPAYGESITIRQLLTHTSGLKDYEELYLKQVGERTPPEQIPQLSDHDVLCLLEQQTETKFAPGARWDYSNSGYAVLANVVERVSGRPFGDFLRERIFHPLRMKRTVAHEKGKNDVPNRAFGYRRASDTGHFIFADQSPTSAVLGDGGVYSSIEELAKWDRALREHTLLGKVEMREALTPADVKGGAKYPDGRPVSYGFGWFLDPYRNHERNWHYGETSGFLTAIHRFPKDGLTVIVLANRTDLHPGDLALKIADLYLK